uniref:(California timema) hypothetical protein n=1 Tax=Timema californicum TaxID=61474 RepID=A0A7R9J6C8_TIMCA|nr:unnamed protein product [Timema californicum]
MLSDSTVTYVNSSASRFLMTRTSCSTRPTLTCLNTPSHFRKLALTEYLNHFDIFCVTCITEDGEIEVRISVGLLRDMVDASRIDIDNTLWDQSTFIGRLKHFFWVTDPRTCIVSERSLDEAKILVEQYRIGKEPPGTTLQQVVYAKKLYESAFHPDTGEKQNVFGRMSFQVPGGMAITGAMLQFYRTMPAVVFWQWVNQSFNALVNYTNRNAKSSLTPTQLGVAYVSASASALVTAIGCKTFWQKHASPIYQCSTKPCCHRTMPAVVFWQWVNQSFNALVNYTNRNAKSSLTPTQLGVAYVSASASALVTAIGCKTFWQKHASPIYQRYVPFAAVAAANCANIPLMRQTELINGVDVFDDKGNKLTESRVRAWNCCGQYVERI